MQLGFGFEICDARGNTPPFLWERAEVLAALDEITQAVWTSVDVETTGLTDASAPVVLDVKSIRMGASATVRLRTIQARIPTINGRSGPRKNFVFDCDRMGPALTEKVSNTLLRRKLLIAHNAGFDTYWLRHVGGRKVWPGIVVDSMLLLRLLWPKHTMVRMDMVADIQSAAEVASAPPEVQAAWKSLIGEASGSSLADAVLAKFGVVVDKTYQKPTNWTGLLGFEHYSYAEDDVIWADRLVCALLGIPEDGDIYQAYISLRARKATLRLLEPQVPELVELRERGMPVNTTIGERYARRKTRELAQKVDELIAIEPNLERHRLKLSCPDAGLDDALKTSLAEAFEARGVELRRTDKTAAPKVGEKDLRACRAAQNDASRPLFNAWVAVCRAKKTRNMALDVVAYAKRSWDGRVRSLLSHGPITGRLAASEPNCFTGATEILTPRGWVRFDHLEDTDLVAQYDQGQLSFVAPTAIVREYWAGSLVSNRTAHTELLTTPLHRCLVETPTGALEVVPGEDYPAEGFQHHAGQYIGGQGALLALPLAFYAAVSVFGHWRGDTLAIETTWLGSPEAVASFASEWGGQLVADTLLFDAQTVAAQEALRRLDRQLSLSDLCLKMSQAQRTAVLGFVDTWLKAGSGALMYCPDRPRAEGLQLLYVLSGQGAWVQACDRGWLLVAKATAKTDISTRIQRRQAYSGMVYCVSVDSGFILVRHNGAPMVTGQCQQWPRDQLFRAMCISDVEPGQEYLQLTATEETAGFLALCADSPVLPGDTVTVETAWTAALFYSDKAAQALSPQTRAAFSSMLDTKFTHVIVASDFGALDVRVGAALAVRAQRDMQAVARGIPVPGDVQPSTRVVGVLQDVMRLVGQPDSVALLESYMTKAKNTVDILERQLDALRAKFDLDEIPRKNYFKQRGEIKENLLVRKLAYRFSQCMWLAQQRGEFDYSALRDAFVADIDIHTFTGMKLVGRDPMQEFSGLSYQDRKELEKKLKKELGPRRQQGKIANLSLLYGMADAGFQEAAARGYDEHWTMEVTHEIRMLWLNAYPEVELWHLWTECLQCGIVYIPEQGKQKPVRTGWWMARTLADREIVAYGLNAALSYQDQSSGADILGMIMHRLKTEHYEVFKCSINQVHDELVLEFPRALATPYLEIVERVMVEEANRLTMPYGVPCAVSPACGPIWVKD